jgi:hypothetical protein
MCIIYTLLILFGLYFNNVVSIIYLILCLKGEYTKYHQNISKDDKLLMLYIYNTNYKYILLTMSSIIYFIILNTFQQNIFIIAFLSFCESSSYNMIRNMSGKDSSVILPYFLFISQFIIFNCFQLLSSYNILLPILIEISFLFTINK